YLSTGATFNQLHLDFLIGKSTVRVIIKETLSVIWKNFQPLEMPEPTKDVWIQTAEGFYNNANFPNCLGAVDGKHIRIINPAKSGSDFFNYKHFFSINLMALVDSNYCFLSIDVGAYGREGDPNVFKKSPLGKKLYDRQLDIPLPKKLPNDDDGVEQPFVIVGDKAFALHENLLRPYPRKNLDLKKKIFNMRLNRARRYVECAFAILANKWRVFHTPILVEPEFTTLIVKSACVIHNFVRRRDGVEYEDTLHCPFESINYETNLARGSTVGARAVRDYFATYFDSPEGKLDWLYNVVH
ncbi:protein ANTAGONIST OF LIKE HETEROCHROMATIN PROTEIN 1-like, partial [Aphis craccivora]